MNSSNSLIRARGLGKRYVWPSQTAEYSTLSDRVGEWISSPWKTFRRLGESKREWLWALRDVDFDIQAGEVVAVIGRNGNGKSTLLKILSRITLPTTGSVSMQGRVSSLLEVGTGFHPELSGAENIYLGGSILGMSRREIRKKYDAIVDFAEVEKFLELPVKRYSSGMRVRLAFSVAAHLDPDILIVDEVLAVGDLAFQKKCLTRMSEFATTGRTILFVSHNMPAVESLCPRAILLSQGRVVADGKTHDVIPKYIRSLEDEEGASQTACIDLRQHPRRSPHSKTVLTKMEIRNLDGELTTSVGVGCGMTFDLSYRTEGLTSGLALSMFLCDDSGQRLAMLHSRVHSRLVTEGEKSGTMRCTLPSVPLVPGDYRIDIAASTWDASVDSIESVARIQIIPSNFLGTGELPNRLDGVFALKCHWERGASPSYLPTPLPAPHQQPVSAANTMRDYYLG